MKNEERNDHITFEIYKLHTELAEQAAQTREGVNRVFSTIVVSIVAAQVLIYRLTPESGMVWFLPVLGILVSVSWSLSLVSMTAKLKAKNQILKIMELEMPFAFFTKENIEYEKSSGIRRKISEQIFPVTLGVCCAGSLTFELIKWLLNTFAGV